MRLPRIYRVDTRSVGTGACWDALLRRCHARGFGEVLLPAPFADNSSDADGDWFSRCSAMDDGRKALPSSLLKACCKQRLALMLELRLDRCRSDDPRALAHPDWFRIDARGAPHLPDPRQSRLDGGEACWRWGEAPVAAAIRAWWQTQMDDWIGAGVIGFCLRAAHRVPAAELAALIAFVRQRVQPASFIAMTHGATAAALAGLEPIGLDGVLSSAPWWDYRAPWYAQEQQRLRAIAPVLVPLDAPAGALGVDAESARRGCARALDFAVASGDGVLIDARFITAMEAVAVGGDETLRQAATDARVGTANRQVAERPALALHALSAPHAEVGAWLREDSIAEVGSARLILVNADLDHARLPAFHAFLLQLGDRNMLKPLLAESDGPDPGAPRLLEAGEVRVFVAQSSQPIVATPATQATRAARSPRIAIEAVRPCVDSGRFAVKRVGGMMLAVEADIFIDGHEAVGAELLWRPVAAKTWQRVRMRALGNDRLRAELPLRRIGRHEYLIEAWHDRYAGIRNDLQKRAVADTLDATDIADAIAEIVRIAATAKPRQHSAVRALLDELRAADKSTQVALLLAERSAEIIAAADARVHRSRSQVFAVDVDRGAAQFAAWYELFPRSQSPEPNRHGRFDDVIGRLDAIKAMGFDVLYLPPIHPIGRSQRKGRNNALVAAAGDPGSVYAIGAQDGGHEAVHAELGSLEDFHRLLAAAGQRGMEIALDFAVQCSPDHPWLKQHPGWFSWRSDGTVRHAENPPKRYEDIVNFDFYADRAIPELWLALRDVVRFWIEQGVTTFRVDNPHTKPFPFWAWLIASIRGQRPDVIFLAEAFTSPKPMRRLAKLGFNQSYTYFTWRNSKAELTGYIEELVNGPEAEYFRPHFFANTPDINPTWLQTAGRAGFVIRAALAATLSGLWGIYSGFELCEADALPGREEYADSEKYQLKPRSWQAPGNIIAEITQLNRIRRLNPALHSHLGTKFQHAGNDHVLYYQRATPNRDNVLLIAVNLDARHAQEADIELPLWQWGMADDGALQVEDLLRGHDFTWRGKWQHVRLDPDSSPYAVWRVRRSPS